MRQLLPILLCLTLSGCPSTGSTPEETSRQVGTAAIVARESAIVWEQTNPELAGTLVEIADGLDVLASAIGSSDDTATQIDAILFMVDVLADKYADDEEVMDNIAPFIATARIVLRTYELNNPDEGEPEC